MEHQGHDEELEPDAPTVHPRPSEAAFTERMEKYRSKDGSKYDCIIPVSGGKDSHFQTHIIKNEFGLNPLLVNFIPIDLVPVGRKNIENLKKFGVDYIEFTPNPTVYRKSVMYIDFLTYRLES